MYDKSSPFSAALAPKRFDTLADKAHDIIGTAILDCRLVPGVAVSEADLSQRFCFGMAAVRAAIARLSAAGWITPDGRRGSLVLGLSPAHLADLSASRRLLEPALTAAAPPAFVAAELLVRAQVHERSADGLVGAALLHQERALLHSIAQSVAAPRLRGWLIDTWDLCLRADRHLDLEFGIGRAPLPLAGLGVAVAQADAPGAAAVLAQMRDEFELRAARALSRSTAPISPAHAAPQAARRADAPSAVPHPAPSQSPRSAKGDPA